MLYTKSSYSLPRRSMSNDPKFPLQRLLEVFLQLNHAINGLRAFLPVPLCVDCLFRLVPEPNHLNLPMFDASARSRTMALTPYEMLVSIIVFVLITAISWTRWHLSSSRAMDLLRNVWPIVIKARRRWSVGVSLPPNWNGAASVSMPTHSLEHVSFYGDVLFCRSSSRQKHKISAVRNPEFPQWKVGPTAGYSNERSGI